jgi:hypothetical protein
MTVSSSVNRNDYAGNGSTTNFAVSFRFLQNSDVKATLRDALSNETLQVEVTDYTLTGAGDAGGGTLVMIVVPPTGTTLTIQRDVPATQETDYVENDEFPAESHEDALDKLTMLVQQQEEGSNRHIGFSDTVSDATGSAVELSQDKTQRADKFLGFDTAGNLVTKTALQAGVIDQNQQDKRFGPIFATVAAMTAANPVSIDGVVVTLVAGMTAETQGYFAAGDGGGKKGIIAVSQAVDEQGSHTNANGTVFLLDNIDAILPQFGAFTARTDVQNLAAIQAASDSGKGVIRVPFLGGGYSISDGIAWGANQTWVFDTGAFLSLTTASTLGHVLGPPAATTVNNVDLINPQIDGGELGHVVANNFGENGIGVARATAIKVLGGHIKGCRRGTADFGGKGVQVENNARDVFVGGGLLIENCSKGFNSNALTTEFALNIVFDGIIVKECWEIFQLDQFFSPPGYSAEVHGVTIDNIRAFNCGIKDFAGATDTGAIVLNRYYGAVIGSVTLTNEASFGTIPALIVDHQSNGVTANDINFFGVATNLLDMRNNASFGTGGDRTDNRWKILHHGTATTLAIADAAGTYDGLHWDIGTDDATATMFSGAGITAQSDVTAKYTNLTSRIVIEGTIIAINNSGINLTTTDTQNTVHFGGRFGSFKFTRGGEDRIGNERDVDVQFQRNGSTRVQLKSNTVNMPVIPTSSAGLSSGDLWANSGVLTIIP